MQIPEKNNPASMSTMQPRAASENVQLMRILARIGWATLILLTLIVIGILGFYFIGDQASWENAIYMTLITISTVGYGEGVPLTSFGAKVLPE